MKRGITVTATVVVCRKRVGVWVHVCSFLANRSGDEVGSCLGGYRAVFASAHYAHQM